MPTSPKDTRSIAELTRTLFGQALSVDEAFDRLGIDLGAYGAERPQHPTSEPATSAFWLDTGVALTRPVSPVAIQPDRESA